jgi:hypothetical protein
MMFVEAALPPLYGSWLRAIAGGPIPAETKATCDHCAMLPQSDAPSANGFFHPSTKCCAYQPHLPNFLAGRILSDDDPSLAAGRRELEQRISKKIAVTPVWAGPGGIFGLLYRNVPGVFGRAPELRCHFLSPTGECGIWRHRPGVCATWFCKHVRGNTSFQFWRLAAKLMQHVEQDMVLWCAAELGAGLTEFLDGDSATSPHVSELGGEIDSEHYRRVWGTWAGREPDFYRACARLVDPLNWEQVQTICGPRVRILADLLRDAYTHLLSDAIPERLRVKQFQITGIEAGHYRVLAYSSLDPLSMPEALAGVLHYFDGRRTEEALATILHEQGVRIDPALVRRMVDFGILEDCNHQHLLPILKSA